MVIQPEELPHISREITSEEPHFVSMQIDASGVIVQYRGVDLPDIGLRAEDVLGEKILDLWAETPALRDFAVRLLAGEPSSITARVNKQDQLPVMHRIFGSPVQPGDADGVIVHAFQIPNSSYVRSRDYQETLRTASETDSLTRAVNRRRFNQELRLQLDIARGSKGRGAIIYMDIDDFKAVNDTLGHAAGDEVLVSVARCLRERLRERDVLGRLGGDEFAILVPGIDGQEAAAIARRLLRAVREHRVIVRDRALSVTMSIGIALYPVHGKTADEIMAHADCAMYKVKDAGRNKVATFDPKADSKASSATRLRWKHGISEALTNNRFLFYAQPIVDLPRSKADQAFARAIGEMARGLGMKVIAEFVGDAETVALLREYGIDYGQGYYLGRPVTIPSAFPSLRQVKLASRPETLHVEEARRDRSAA